MREKEHSDSKRKILLAQCQKENKRNWCIKNIHLLKRKERKIIAFSDENGKTTKGKFNINLR